MITKQLVSKSEVIEILGSQIFKDATAAGWIRPRSIKKGRTPRKEAKIIYALSDVREVEERILRGEYPHPPQGAKPDWFGKAKNSASFF